MDYKKKYKEALEWIRDLYPTMEGATREDAEHYFPELKESKDEKIKKEIVELVMQPTWKTETEFNRRKELVAWLEKQGEEKPADTFEPKFKVGDWIIFNNHHESIYQVEKIENYRYCLRHYLGGLVSIHYDTDLIRLWTIQDAKDGDVLVTLDNRPFIYKGCFDHNHPNSPVAYCGINSQENFQIDRNNVDNWWTRTKVQPATKEQRDILFAKMKEAGYEWDAKRKRLCSLNKSEVTEICNQGNKSIWSEEDESLYNYLHDELNASLKDYCGASLDDMKEAIEWFKSLKNRVHPKAEWSELDLWMIDTLCSIFEINYFKDYYKTTPKGNISKEAIGSYEIINWLNSVKDRIK